MLSVWAKLFGKPVADRNIYIIDFKGLVYVGIYYLGDITIYNICVFINMFYYVNPACNAYYCYTRKKSSNNFISEKKSAPAAQQAVMISVSYWFPEKKLVGDP